MKKVKLIPVIIGIVIVICLILCGIYFFVMNDGEKDVVEEAEEVESETQQVVEIPEGRKTLVSDLMSNPTPIVKDEKIYFLSPQGKLLSNNGYLSYNDGGMNYTFEGKYITVEKNVKLTKEQLMERWYIETEEEFEEYDFDDEDYYSDQDFLVDKNLNEIDKFNSDELFRFQYISDLDMYMIDYKLYDSNLNEIPLNEEYTIIRHIDDKYFLAVSDSKSDNYFAHIIDNKGKVVKDITDENFKPTTCATSGKYAILQECINNQYNHKILNLETFEYLDFEFEEKGSDIIDDKYLIIYKKEENEEKSFFYYLVCPIKDNEIINKFYITSVLQGLDETFSEKNQMSVNAFISYEDGNTFEYDFENNEIHDITTQQFEKKIEDYVTNVDLKALKQKYPKLFEKYTDIKNIKEMEMPSLNTTQAKNAQFVVIETQDNYDILYDINEDTEIGKFDLVFWSYDPMFLECEQIINKGTEKEETKKYLVSPLTHKMLEFTEEKIEEIDTYEIRGPYLELIYLNGNHEIYNLNLEKIYEFNE